MISMIGVVSVVMIGRLGTVMMSMTCMAVCGRVIAMMLAVCLMVSVSMMTMTAVHHLHDGGREHDKHARHKHDRPAKFTQIKGFDLAL